MLFWIGLGVMVSLPAFLLVWLTGLYFYLCWKYLSVVVRIFQEKPLFVVPRGQPRDDVEVVRFPTTDGLTLHGCYLPGQGRRRGVILFGLEFGSACWSCQPYVEHLTAAGFDVFAFESRNQGESGRLSGYDPLPWVTEYEVQDARAALAYLGSRPDADPAGVGLFGISKGAGAALLAAVDNPRVRCFATDGAFATYTTLMPYMRRWFAIYWNNPYLQEGLPWWFLGAIGLAALHRVERQTGCRFAHLDRVIGKLAPRPLLMIHGQADTYITPDMARALFDRAGEPKEFWLVAGAKHNQALHCAGPEYRQRVLRFFEQHLARPATEPLPPGEAGKGGPADASAPPVQGQSPPNP